MKSKQIARKAQVIGMDGYDVAVTRKRVKNINLRVHPDGSVSVSAPARVPLEEIERFVRSKDAWIRERLRRLEELATPRTLRDGLPVALWGKEVTLRVRPASRKRDEGAALVDGELVVSLSQEGGDSQGERLTQLVRTWQRQELARVIEELLPLYEARVGKRASRIRIRSMSSRWGSCNVKTGSITINLELVERPRLCLESVLAHELCHLWEANHGPGFYAHLDQACPAWRDARRILNDRPPRRS